MFATIIWLLGYVVASMGGGVHGIDKNVYSNVPLPTSLQK